MTFDEAIEELRLAIPKSFYSPTMHDIAVMLEAQTKVINLLRQEYAPTVEMTNYQKGLLLRYLEDLPFSDLISDVYLSRAGGAGDEHGDRYDDLSDEDIMNAWLHPETINVVEE